MKSLKKTNPLGVRKNISRTLKFDMVKNITSLDRKSYNVTYNKGPLPCESGKMCEAESLNSYV